ncbi:MAG: thiamine phosphate synthase [Oscillatoriales cyanobacterium SM2_1_8]|nr:thiamine phosphate synthase [Oscillatoriales cyanobacterium SM2_1_8]
MQPVYRILDANLDRAREALRVLEDWYRLGWEDRARAQTCKELRHELAAWHRPELRAARQTETDPGTDLVTPGEQKRVDVAAVLQANFARLQEALRAIEEFGKLDDGNLAAAAKQWRYQTYILESGSQRGDRRYKLQQARLYLVTMPCDNLETIVEQALRGGVAIVQYREKAAEDGARYQQAQVLCALCRRYDALFVVNDRLDLALAVGADGVHVGQTDLPVSAIRPWSRSLLVGQSTTNPEELAKALAAEVDYVGVGPVFATPTKPGKAAAGLSYVAHAAAHATVPWFAIGGIDPDNLPGVQAAGATRVAVVRSLMAAADPEPTARRLQDLLR